MRILLTGAAGFIGAHVATELRAAQHEVIEVDALLPSAHPAGTAPDGLHRIDVRDADGLAEVLVGVDVVCHQAAVVGSGIGPDDAPAYASHNDFGTAVLLAAMHRAGCARLVLASSMVVYGEGRYRCDTCGIVDPLPRTPDDLDAGRFDNRCPISGDATSWELVPEDAALRPRSTYAASKVAQEHYASAWAAATGGSVTALRYHNVYGDLMPSDTPYSGVAAMFRSSVAAGRAPAVFEDGAQTRDFVHVHDVAVANRLAIEAALSGFDALNVCSGQPITIGTVADILAKTAAGPAPVVTGQYRPGDVRHVVADPARAYDRLGFRATTRPADGLAAFADAPLRARAAESSPSA